MNCIVLIGVLWLLYQIKKMNKDMGVTSDAIERMRVAIDLAEADLARTTYVYTDYGSDEEVDAG